MNMENEVKQQDAIEKTLSDYTSEIDLDEDFGKIENEVPFKLTEEEPTDVVTVRTESKQLTPKKVDLANIKIVSRDPISKEKDLREALYGKKQTFQIIAAQSGYSANIAPLVHKDIVSLLYTNVGRYQYKKTIYNVIFNKVQSFSVGPMTFEEWLKNTTVEDIETFYYGVYCATYPKNGSVTLQCPECGEENTYTISNNNLFTTTDRAEMNKRINLISQKAVNKEAMKELSFIGENKDEVFELPESEVIIKLRTPSLWDSLEILRLIPEKIIDRDTESVTNMLYIDQILIPTTANGETYYSEESSRKEILRFIDNLPVNDANILTNAIYDRVENNRITYSIKNIKCPTCNNVIKELPISIEDTLFQQIFERGQ